MALPEIDYTITHTVRKATEHPLAENVVLIGTAVLVAAILGQLLIKVSLSKPLQNLTKEIDRLTEKRAGFASRQEVAQMLSQEREQDLQDRSR